ncbi:hypothetical protein BN14_10250 [Rhizoctonia solani AG-1 IB]|uniref:DUF6534 domain-containing protein n=1 Tax=Thanatephorus cucumeris (strain AG1-IB / isolate 7/3/14) TaxID=1108050 RepID=M5C9Q8_THACB|nr:hypothetical protein BN14_10250 [Rhizoctonia solani AG-1 IB]
MGEMDAMFGATYIGVVLSTFLYGILTLQTYVYWFKYVHDGAFDRWFVLALWLMDTIQSVCICHMQYHYTITNYANPEALQFNNWSLNFEVGFTAIITFMVQAFFARRAWFFTKRVGSRFTTTRKTQLLGAIVGLLAAMGLGFGLASFAMTFVLGRFSRFIEYRWLVGIWLGAAAFCDVVIVYMLSTALMTQRTGFGRTDALINKLLRYTINTGLLTSLIAVADLICFCTMNNLVHLGFNMVLGKLYTNTLLATLNARDTEPANVVHVEEGSYNLKERQQNASHGQIKFNRPPGMTSSQASCFAEKPCRRSCSVLTIHYQQDRGEPVIHLHTDTTIEVSNTESRRRSSRDQVYPGHPQVVVIQHNDHTAYNPNKDIEYDADGADSVDSFKKGRS